MRFRKQNRSSLPEDSTNNSAGIKSEERVSDYETTVGLLTDSLKHGFLIKPDSPEVKITVNGVDTGIRAWARWDDPVYSMRIRYEESEGSGYKGRHRKPISMEGRSGSSSQGEGCSNRKLEESASSDDRKPQNVQSTRRMELSSEGKACFWWNALCQSYSEGRHLGYCDAMFKVSENDLSIEFDCGCVLDGYWLDKDDDLN